MGRPRHARAREIELYGSAAQKIGGEWVDTLRAHVNKRIFYYYLHLTKAHLKEIIIATGHPFNGDDSVNEKGNQLSKRQKTTIFHGGSDAAGKRTQSYVRRRAIKGATDEETGEAATIGYGERTYQRENSHGIAQQAMGLQLIRESIDAERLRRRSAAQGLREKVKTAAGRETMRIKAELKYASADRAVEELHAAYDEAVAAREGAVAAAGTEGA